MDPEQLQGDLLMVARIAGAMLLGGIVGYERELARQAAGLRTHMLIAGAAALIVGLGRLLAVEFSDDAFSELVRVDPVRLVEAVVAAVGFVGAGSIIRSREDDAVHGLTTAASMLVVAGLGIAVALDHYALAVAATLLTVAVTWLLGAWERRLVRLADGPKRSSRKA
jgi:putative Mg2+ transporter-C (MgtC) family protein